MPQNGCRFLHSFLVPSLSLRFLAPLSLGPGADCSFRKLCIWWRPWARAMQEFRRGPCHHRVRPSSLAIVGGGLAPRCPGQAPEASPPPPIGSVPRVVRHVGSGAAQHPGATAEGNNLENKISFFRKPFFRKPMSPPCPPISMLRWRSEILFARRETIWRVPTGDLLFPANIEIGG